MPKVLLKRSYAKDDAKIRSLSQGEVAVITDADNPGLAFKDNKNQVVFIGANGNCNCSGGTSGGGSTGGGGTSADLSDYQKKVITPVNNETTVEGSLQDLDKRINKLEKTKPTYTKDEIYQMGELGTLAGKNIITLNELGTCVKQQLALGQTAVQPEDLSGYQKQQLATSIAGKNTVEEALSSLESSISDLSTIRCQCSTASWVTDKNDFLMNASATEELIQNNN